MEKKLNRRKLLRRKYKRYAAVMAGAAFISGAALHGLPPAKAYASENPVATPAARVKQITVADFEQPFKRLKSDDFITWKFSSHRPNRHHEDHRNWSERDYGHDTYVSQDGSVVVRYLDSPVDTIKKLANTYGFDAARDTFTFLSLSSREASVLVTKHATGERFKVDLFRGRHSGWHITAVRGVD